VPFAAALTVVFLPPPLLLPDRPPNEPRLTFTGAADGLRVLLDGAGCGRLVIGGGATKADVPGALGRERRQADCRVVLLLGAPRRDMARAAEVFKDVKSLDVIGTSKGKGTAGVMKRHHFGGQPASHGTERKHRSPGSLASRATWRGQSGKPKKGVRMAGHMGMDRVTTRNHPLLKIDPANNLLLIKGALPGPNGGLLFIRKSITARVREEK